MTDSPLVLLTLWLLGAVLFGAAFGCILADAREDDEPDTHDLAEWTPWPPADQETD